MTQMSMNRAIHGAVRRDLGRFIAALDAFPDGDRGRAEQLNRAWINFDAQLTRHHEGEHAVAWPALESLGVSKDLLTTMDAEHASMSRALDDTRSAMAALTRTPGAAQATAASDAFRRLQEVTVHHLDHEEAETEQVYWTKRDTPELKAMGKAFGKVSPTVGGQFFAWVLDGASSDERAAVHRDVPGPVITLVGGVFGRSYRKNIAPTWQS